MLVDDDPRFATLVEQHLRGHGYEVTLADSVASASEALLAAAAVEEAPDVVLLDINLPDEAGWALLRTQAYGTAGSPPMVVITATAVSPRKLREPGIAGCLHQAVRHGDPAVDHRPRPPSGGIARDMTDLSIALISAACVVLFAGYLVLCERVRR